MFFKPRILVLWGLALAGLIAFGGLLASREASKPATVIPGTGGPQLAAFDLVDQNGVRVQKGDLLGRPVVLFFGFTFCPDVCPTTLAAMTADLAKLGPDGDRIATVFVSVDPARDTPAVLKAYLEPFDARIRGLTGDPAQVAALARPLGIYFAKVETGGGTYTVDHSALMVLLDSRGQFFGTIAYEESREVAVMKLKRLASEGYR
jgi:protein SCO1/2